MSFSPQNETETVVNLSVRLTGKLAERWIAYLETVKVRPSRLLRDMVQYSLDCAAEVDDE